MKILFVMFHSFINLFLLVLVGVYCGQLERWEAAIQDYEMLIQETPGDEELGRALFEAQIQLKKQCSDDINDMNFGPNLIHISSNGHFRHFVTAPGN